MSAPRAALLVLALAVWATPAHAQSREGAVDRAALEKRMHQVNVLSETSSAAKQVEASGNPGALERREQARRAYRQALAAFQSGQLAQSSERLTEASARMFEAVRLAAPEKVAADKMRSDFEGRMASAKALYDAQKRIAAEKPGTLNATETSAELERLIEEAQRLESAGQLEAARATLQRAYLIAKAAISSMRGGDTLVRSLNFASAEDEYRDEIDRNDTHQMLMKVLVGERSGSADGMVQGFVGKAAALRERAERAARGGDHKGAIRLLEESTRELVRAIRGAGIYIPG